MSKTKKHCMLHSPPCMGCDGCIAKSRQKQHYKGAFARQDAKYEHVVTMDQLTLIDVENTIGLGGYKSAIVFCKVKEDYWQFIPLKRLGAIEAEVHFRQFCLACNCAREDVMVYCDAHLALIKVCNSFGAPNRYPPPGRPQADTVVERKVGLSLPRSCGQYDG